MLPTANKSKIFLKIIAVTVFILYLSYLFYLTFFSHLYGRGYFHRSMNLVPFTTIQLFMVSGRIRGILVNVFGNIAAFIPMGVLFPLVFNKSVRLCRTLLITFAVSLMIEIVQYAFGVGAADIDDLKLNLTGGLAGYVIFMALRALYRHIVRPRRTLAE